MEGMIWDPAKLREGKAWRGFRPGRWERAIDVRDFIISNVTPYQGDEGFLVGPSPRTAAVWEKLRPYFAREAGSSFANSMEFATGNGRYVISGDGGVLEIDGESNMLWTLLGAPPGSHIQNVRATGTMKNVLEKCLPISLPSVHLNNI